MHPAITSLRLLLFVLLATCVLRAADAPSPTASSTDLHALLVQAVTQRRVVTFNYDGRRRVVEPHAYGRSRKGHNLLRGFDVEAAAVEAGRAKKASGWALYSVDKMANVEVTERTFAEPRPGYRRGDRKMRRIHVEL
ncbi:MAG TPA: WYL domain-containing protein [Opitutaceae bacterium]